MGKTALRGINNVNTIDAMNDNEDLISLGVTASESALGSGKKNVAMNFKGGNIVMHNSDELSLDYPEMFTVCFWAKLTEKTITDTVYPNRFSLVMDDGTVAINYELPDDVLDGGWHYYILQRDGSNNIKLYIDADEKVSVSNSKSFNLTNNSYVYLGNNNPSATGYDVVLDDLIIINTVVYSDVTANPTDYMDLSMFKKCLYIKVSTGEVFGYKED